MNIRMSGPGSAGAIGMGPRSFVEAARKRRERLTFGHGRLGGGVAAAPDPTVVARLTEEPQPVALLHPETWDWGWGGLLFFSVLLFFRPQDHLPSLGSLHLSEVTALLGLGSLALHRLSRGLPLVRMTPEVIGIFGLGAVIGATTPFSIWPGGAFHMFFDIYVKVALIFALFVSTVTSPRRIHRLCWVIVLASGVLGAHAILDSLRGINLVEGSRVRGAVGGIFANPNDLALNMVAFLPLALVIALRRGRPSHRLIALGVAGLMFVAIVLTKSRSGFLGFGAMAATFVVMSMLSRALKPGLVLAGLLALLAAAPLLPQTFWDRMASIAVAEKDETGSREARMRLMAEAFQTFLDHPLTGVGAGQFENYAGPGRQEKWRVTHNVVLQIAAEIGIFGLALFLFLIVRGYQVAFWTRCHTRARPRRWGETNAPPAEADGLTSEERTFLQMHGSAMVASLTGWLVCALFASVAFNWTFYYVLGLACVGRQVVAARAAAARRAQTAATPAAAGGWR